MMKKKWIPFIPFVLYDHIGIERYLEKQARKGWMLERADSGMTFRRAELQEIHFSVCYFPGFEEFYPVLTHKQQEFLELCAHDGWELVTNTPGMLILCNRESDPTPIETDPVMTVDAIYKTMRRSDWSKKIGPAVYLGGLSVLYGIRAAKDDLIGMLSAPYWVTMLLGALLWLVICSLQWNGFLLWYRKVRRVAEREGRLHPVRMGWDFSPLLVAAILFAVAWLCYSYERKLYMILFAAVFGAVTFFIPRIESAMERRKVSQKKQNLIILAIVLSLVVGLSALSIHWEANNTLLTTSTKAEPYICEHLDRDPPYVHEVYREEIPLRIEDIMGDEYIAEQYHANWERQTSPILGRYVAIHKLCGLNQGIRYTIIETKWPALYTHCLDAAFDGRLHELIQENTPGGEGYRVYLYHGYGYYNYVYQLCFEDRIVTLESDWPLTEEQLAIAAERLRDCPLPNT